MAPACCFSIQVDRSNNNGNPFNDEFFDIFNEKFTVSSDGKYLNIEITLNLEENHHRDCGKFLEAFVKSNLFQNHAKKVCTLLSFSEVSLDDWKNPFLGTFAQHQSTINELKLTACRLTDQGAYDLAWALDNEKSGLEIKSLGLNGMTAGNNVWVTTGLYKNTTITKITTTGNHCTHAVLDFFRKCCYLNRFKKLEYNGLFGEESLFVSHTKRVTIQLGHDHDEELYYMSRIDQSFYMAWTSDGNVRLSIKDSRDRYVKKMEIYWGIFQNLLSFRKEKPKALNISLINSVLGGSELFFRMIAAYKTPIKELMIYDCFLPKDFAINLGWLFDTNISGVNIEKFRLRSPGGKSTWASGLYKNKSLTTLHLENFEFLHSVLHFIRNGGVHKLKSVTFWNLNQEKDEKPCGIDDETLALIESTVDYDRQNLISLERIKCGCDYVESFGHHESDEIKAFPEKICKSLASVLRSCSNLKYLEVNSVKLNPECDFLKDATSCQEISLTNTGFDPHVVASLVNSTRQLKRLCLDGYRKDSAAVGKVTTLLEQADLTLLDELCLGRYIALDVFWNLFHQFGKDNNNGPRKFTRHFDREYDGDDYEENFELEDLGKGLVGNTHIEEIKVEAYLNVRPCEMIYFLRMACQMPKLKKIKVSDVRAWDEFEDEDGQDDAEECSRFVMKQLLERNIVIDLSDLWMNDYEFQVLLRTFQQCKLLLGRETNDLADGLWAHVLAHVNKRSSWVSDRDKCTKNMMDVLFYLVGQLSRLFQQAGNQVDQKEPRFSVPHHPNCPGCHKRQKVLE